MGSKSDWGQPYKKAEVSDPVGVASTKRKLFPHTTPDLMCSHAEEARSRVVKIII